MQNELYVCAEKKHQAQGRLALCHVEKIRQQGKYRRESWAWVHMEFPCSPCACVGSRLVTSQPKGIQFVELGYGHFMLTTL